jgi:hypothetical protein
MSLRGNGLRAAAVLASAALALGPVGSARADSGQLVDPANNDAMLNILMHNGVEYDTAQDVDEALAYQGPDATLVINDDETALSQAEITDLATTQWGRVVILTDDPAVLSAFAPGVQIADGSDNAEPTSDGVPPACTQTDAVAAGPVRSPSFSQYFSIHPAFGAAPSASAGTGATASASADASSFVSDVTGCYDITAHGHSESMMVTLNDSRTGGDVVVLGNSDFTENQYLSDAGDAALALRLFGAHSDLVWLAASFTEDPNLGDCNGVPCSGGAQPSGSASGGSGSGQMTATPSPSPGQASAKQVNSLLPHWIWWAVLQLALAAGALAYWRARRMGRLVGEALPVRVRAAETVEGHANLYRRAAAHGRAAALLRAAAARRIAPLLGLPAGPAGRAPQTLVVPLAARLGRTPEEVHAVLVGVVPQTEAELVRLTDQLDQLEQEVRSR